MSEEKWQYIIILRHQGQSIQKMSRTFNVSSSAVSKTIKLYDETGFHEDHHRKGRPRVTSAAELPASEIAAQINASQSSSNTHLNINSSTGDWFTGDCESGLHGQFAAKKLLLKDTNKKKTLAWAKKHKQWILDQWKYVFWSDESKLLFFGSNRHVFVRHRVGERINSACVVPTTVMHGGGVMLWGCFAGDTVSDLFRIHGTLNQYGYHSILQRYAIPSGLRLVGLSFVLQHDNDPTHLQAVRFIWPRRRVMECCMRWLASTITRLQPNRDGFGWVKPQSEGKAAKSACWLVFGQSAV